MKKFALVLAGLLALACAPASAAVLLATPSTWASAYAASKAGDEIDLGDGNFGDLSLRKAGLTLKGGKGAVVRSINITSPGGSDVLDGFACKLTPDATTIGTTACIRAASVNDITVRNLTITCGAAVFGVPQDADPAIFNGDKRPGDNVLGLPTGQGVRLDFVTGAVVDNVEISNCGGGIGLTDGAAITVRNSYVHDIRTTPIGGSVLRDITIDGNTFTRSTPWKWGNFGDHGDDAHLWTDAKFTARVMNITITNNRMIQTNPLLGIYLDDNYKGIGFGNVTIGGNVIVGAQGQGILLENAFATVTGNTLLEIAGDPHHDAPSIRLDQGATIVATGNVAHDLYGALKALPAANGNVIMPALVAAAAPDTRDAQISADAMSLKAANDNLTAANTNLAAAKASADATAQRLAAMLTGLRSLTAAAAAP